MRHRHPSAPRFADRPTPEHPRRAERRAAFAGVLGIAPALAIFLLACGVARSAPPTAWTLTRLDGSSFLAVPDTIAPDGTIAFRPAASGSAAPVAAPINLQELRRIERSPAHGPATPPSDATALIHLEPAGTLRASGVTLTADTLDIAWAPLGSLKIPARAVRAIRFLQPSPNKPARTAAPSDPDPSDDPLASILSPAPGDRPLATDRLFAIQPPSDPSTARPAAAPSVVTADGTVESIAADAVAFEWDGQTRRLPIQRAYAVALARTLDPAAAAGGPGDELGRVTLATADGSTLDARLLELTGERLLLELIPGVRVNLPLHAVRRIDVRSDRMAYLSDLRPITVRHDDPAHGPWRRDQTTIGTPVSIRSRLFEKALGVHAPASLTFRVDPRFRTLSVTPAIDDAARGGGDAVFVVTLDGAEVFRRRITGRDNPEPITLPLAGASTLTLSVEAGHDLDLGDIAVWADARLLR